MSFVGILALAAILFSFAAFVHANPSYFVRSTGTGATIDSLTYIATAGTATTTETWNTIQNGGRAMNSAVLMLAIKSSTTVSTLFGTTTISIRIEQSDDNSNWVLATSSTIQTTTTEQIGGSFVSTTSPTLRTISVDTSLPYVRALIGLNPGTSNRAGIWARFVGKQETN